MTDSKFRRGLSGQVFEGTAKGVDGSEAQPSGQSLNRFVGVEQMGFRRINPQISQIVHNSHVGFLFEEASQVFLTEFHMPGDLSECERQSHGFGHEFFGFVDEIV